MNASPPMIFLLFFSVSVVYVYYGIYVLRLDRESILNRLFFAICISLSIWACAYAFALSAPDAETALLWRRISAVGYCSIYSMLFHFLLILTRRTRVLAKPWVYLLIYLPAAVLTYVFALSSDLAMAHHHVIRASWGWHAVPLGWSNLSMAWNWVFNVYYSSAILAGLALVWQWGRKATAVREKKQARLIMVTVMAAAAAGSAADMILLNFPQMAALAITIPIWGTWYSITRYRLMALSFHDAAEDILQIMNEGLLLIDQDGTIMVANRSAQTLLGYRENELVHRSITSILEEDSSFYVSVFDDHGESQRPVRFEERSFMSKGAGRLPTLFSSAPLRDEWGDTLGLVCVFSDLTDRKRAEEALQSAHDELERRVLERTAELAMANEALQGEIVERQSVQERIEYLAFHDHLTDLPNRLLFTERLGQAILQAERTGKLVAVMFLDLDVFKRVNDTMGHALGDQLLVEVSKRLSGTLRKSDTVARFGGDEFMVMIQNTDMPKVTRAVERIIHAFKQPFTLHKQDFNMTVSIGVAVYPTDGKDVETLIKNADIAMYRAKDSGRNRCVFCSPMMRSEVMETMKLTNSLYRALERDELMLYYQPQINCCSGEIVGLEALLRWQHPELGMVLPGRFIPIAEYTGLIMPIGKWVLRTACRQNKIWQDAGLIHARMAVNLSPYQFQGQALVDDVATILNETGLGPEYLELEITESVLMHEAEHIVGILKGFKSLGVSLAIDDFGTEYSSMMYLRQLPVNRIKIAMPFVHGISVSDKDEAITKAIIVLAHSLGLQVLAEGVETDDQRAFLTQRMCDEVQGFYYYEPMPAHEIEALLRRS